MHGSGGKRGNRDSAMWGSEFNCSEEPDSWSSPNIVGYDVGTFIFHHWTLFSVGVEWLPHGAYRKWYICSGGTWLFLSSFLCWKQDMRQKNVPLNIYSNAICYSFSTVLILFVIHYLYTHCSVVVSFSCHDIAHGWWCFHRLAIDIQSKFSIFFKPLNFSKLMSMTQVISNGKLL